MTNYKTVFFAFGTLLIILGFFMMVPVIVQLIYDEFNGTFIYSSLVTIFIGTLFLLSNLDQNKKLNLQQAFLLTSLSWIGIATFGSLPFIFSSLELTFSDAFFESMSGITTTGSTVIGDLNNTPKAILIWRSTLQWLGGIGIVVMAITVMPLLNVGGMQLFKMESGDTTEKILPKTKEIAFNIISIYFFLSAACAIAYFFSGMNIFDSIAHAMTTIATGGFSTHNESIGYFQNPKIEIVSIIFIILGSLPFIAYLKYLAGNNICIPAPTQLLDGFTHNQLCLSTRIGFCIVKKIDTIIICKFHNLSCGINAQLKRKSHPGAIRKLTYF